MSANKIQNDPCCVESLEISSVKPKTFSKFHIILFAAALSLIVAGIVAISVTLSLESGAVDA